VTVTGALRAFQPSTGSFDPLIEVAPYRAAGQLGRNLAHFVTLPGIAVQSPDQGTSGRQSR
jgi:hypothetical protein